MKKILVLFTLYFCFATLTVEAQKKSNPMTDPHWGFIVEEGEKAPNFKARYTDGSKLNLKKLRGKVVMLQFTASWCKVCVKEMPYIEREIWQEHKDKDFVVIGIDMDEPLDDVLKFIERTGITYPMALDPRKEIFQLFADVKTGVARNVIIDKKGNVQMATRLFKRTEFNEMKEKIAELIKE